MDLHPLEIKVIEGLKKLGGKGSASAVAEAAGIQKLQAERFGYSLSQKGLAILEKKVVETPKLTDLGRKYLSEGLPEGKILSALKKGPQNIMELADSTGLDKKEIEACFGILKKNGWAVIKKTEIGLELELTEIGKLESSAKNDLEKPL